MVPSDVAFEVSSRRKQKSFKHSQLTRRIARDRWRSARKLSRRTARCARTVSPRKSCRKPALEVVVEQVRESKPAIPTPSTPLKAQKLSLHRAEVFRKPPILSSRFFATARTTRPAKPTSPLFRRDQFLIGFLRPLGATRHCPGYRPRKQALLPLPWS